MYRLQHSDYDTKLIACDKAVAKQIMRNFLSENGLHIVLPATSTDVEGKDTINPSIAKCNYLYDNGQDFRGVMYYNKKTCQVVTCHRINTDTKVVGDDEFMPTLMGYLRKYKGMLNN